MQTRILLFFALLGLAINLKAQPNHDAYNLAMDKKFGKGEVIVKFKDDAFFSFSKSDGVLKTGRSDIDRIFEKYSVEGYVKVFRDARPDPTVKMNRFPDGREHPVPQLYNIYTFTFPETYDPVKVADELNTLDQVDYAEPNIAAFIHGYVPESKPLSENEITEGSSKTDGGLVPNDPMFTEQWYIPHTKVNKLWNEVTGDTTQVIAILDTGVDWNHPDLKNKIWKNPNETLNGQDSDGNGFVDDLRGWDFVNNNNDPMDDNSHGTHCAGIAAAEADNGIGIAGVSWGARIMPIKVFQSNGVGYASQIAEGIWYAAENGATIFSNSWGSTGESITIRLALEYAYAHGTIIAAAGNRYEKIDHPTPPWPPTVPMFPACYNWVIGVEATDQSGNNAWFSNFDPTGPVISDGRPYGSIFFNDRDFNYEVRAPGVGLLSTVPGGQYRVYSGTSMAAPLVAGGIALMKSHDPTLNNEMIFAKLIQPIKINKMQAGIMDIHTSTVTNPPPDLYFVAHNLVDTLYGGNADGQPNPGETIEIFVSVKNAGGLANAVKAQLRFKEFEDQTTASITKTTSNIGSVSAYGTIKSTDALKVHISEDVAHARIISFEVLIYQEGKTDTVYTDLPIKVRRGIEIKGTHEGLVHLKDDGYYVVTEPAVIDSLIIEPGITLRFANHSFIMIAQYMEAIGEPYNMITFMGDVDSQVKGIIMADNAFSHFEYCIFQDGLGAYTEHAYLVNPKIIRHSIFRYNHYKRLFDVANEGYYENNVILENYFYGFGEHNLIMYWGSPNSFRHNIFSNNHDDHPTGSAIKFYGWSADHINVLTDNAFINNKSFSVGTSSWNGWPIGIYKIKQQYWGGTSEEYVNNQILDFYDFSDRAVLEPDSILERPPSEAHGVVWKVELNGQDPMNGNMEHLGAGPVQFDVYFNRPMNIEFPPFVTFGVRPPYTQNLVFEGATWSADSTVWTAYHNVSLNTGDGINTVRVAYAQDTEGFEIPIERERFKFTVQVAGSQSVEFYAEPGIGKVNLQWPESDETDVLGYNIYRYSLWGEVSTDTLLINDKLLTESNFIDYSVTPDTTYYYMFAIMNTDFDESDLSKVVSATPFGSANGDANGDNNVDVLDIVAIVSYMLGQNPQPFLFDAADINGDGVINILDIVGVIHLINQGKGLARNEVATSLNPAFIFLENNLIRVESEGQLAALQFELQTNFPEYIQLSTAIPGFELAWTVTESGIRGILFNMHGNTIEKGLTEIIHIEHNNPDLVWGDIFGSDPSGRYIDVLTQTVGIDERTALPLAFSMELYPNPAKDQVTVDYFLPVLSDVQVVFYDIFGRELKTITSGRQTAGKYTHTIGTESLGHSQGLVLCRITAMGANGEVFQKVLGLAIIK